MDGPYFDTLPEAAQFADHVGYERLLGWLLNLSSDADQRALATLRILVGMRQSAIYEADMIPRLAARAIVHRGPEGVAMMEGMVRNFPTAPDSLVLFRELWEAGEGRPGPLSPLGNVSKAAEPLVSPPSRETQLLARNAAAGLLADSLTDNEALFGILLVLVSMGKPEANPDNARRLLRGLTESSIRLTPKLMEEFEALIEAEESEERYQRFLAAYPVFLDPLAAEVLPKQKLGLEYVTDYAVRRHDDRWLLVEIEKPQDRIVTLRNDLTRGFNHAFGQIVDFQRWVETHNEYAQERMPGIASPQGLLVIGRRSQLDAKARGKLRRFCANSATIDVLTFDDLAANARSLYASLRLE